MANGESATKIADADQLSLPKSFTSVPGFLFTSVPGFFHLRPWIPGFLSLPFKITPSDDIRAVGYHPFGESEHREIENQRRHGKGNHLHEVVGPKRQNQSVDGH